MFWRILPNVVTSARCGTFVIRCSPSHKSPAARIGERGVLGPADRYLALEFFAAVDDD